MKKTMKKALSVFLAVIVAALMVVPSAFAVSYPEGVTKEKAENAIEKTDDVIYNAVMALENTTLKELITKELYTSDTLSMLLTGVYGMLSEMEAELLQKINNLGIGPAGLGGRTTALAVNVETYATHIAGLPVGINICCHVNRHIVRVI